MQGERALLKRLLFDGRCRKLCSSNAAAVVGRGQEHPEQQVPVPAVPQCCGAAHTHTSEQHACSSMKPNPAQCCSLHPGVILSSAVLWQPSQHLLRDGAGPAAPLCSLCPVQGSPWGIAALACELTSAPACSSQGLAARRSSTEACVCHCAVLSGGSGLSHTCSASEHRQGESRRKGFWCPPRLEQGKHSL